LFEAVKTILPTGLWYQIKEIWHVAEGLSLQDAVERSATIKNSGSVLDVLFSSEGRSDLETLKNLCGDDILPTLRGMQREGVLVCESSTTRRVNDKTRRMVSLALYPEDAMAIMEPKRRSAPQRYEVVKMLSSIGKISASELSYFTGASAHTLRGLEKSGIISFSQEEELRVPVILSEDRPTPIVLNDEQQSAFDQILSLTKTGKSEAVLLHGVTGSGKTQIYIRLVEEILAQGKTAIILVPEIALTPQMVQRFRDRFGESVSVLHSALSLAERRDQWARIRSGQVRVAVGARSAVFAPFENASSRTFCFDTLFLFIPR
jgi:primosomal protein N' (replication factor Y)